MRLPLFCTIFFSLEVSSTNIGRKVQFSAVQVKQSLTVAVWYNIQVNESINQGLKKLGELKGSQKSSGTGHEREGEGRKNRPVCKSNIRLITKSQQTAIDRSVFVSDIWIMTCLQVWQYSIENLQTALSRALCKTLQPALSSRGDPKKSVCVLMLFFVHAITCKYRLYIVFVHRMHLDNACDTNAVRETRNLHAS